MPVEKKSLAPEDLVLHLNKEVESFDVSRYEDFLYELCDWDFLKESIRKVLKLYLSGKYGDTKQLLEENYDKNQKMQSFASKSKFVGNLPFPHKLSCTLDIATGGGKSWAIYAIARIMLAEGVVDRVLVLCPSKTIKNELYKKFTNFTSNTIITDALPKGVVIRVPGIKHSDETIEVGDICIDNVHKTYDHVSSSITDSLKHNGQRTLVINDEAHHILNPKESDKATSLEWGKFLKDKKYNFKYVLNVTGTPYKGNSYFNDVIYRYSIREAISNRFVKDIYYLTKDTSENWKQKWKAILSNHEELKREYPKAKKHITIVVTNTVANCNKLTEEIKSFLRDNTKLSDEDVDKKVLPVTSSPQHDTSREILKTVDLRNNPVEWIVSVSMLTEGWDVSNIFQIVPHDSRAFNSKLLISQVLGRGLRIPSEYRDTDILPKVWVYNHAAWSAKIDKLVAEVAEISNLISSTIINDSKYNFPLYRIDIKKEKVNTKKVEQESKEIKIPKKLGFSTTNRYKRQEYTNVKTHRMVRRETKIELNEYTVEEATNEIFTMLFVFDMNRGTTITERVDKDLIRNLIKKELRSIGETKVSEQNLQKAKSSFGVLFRSVVGLTEIKELYQGVEKLNTSEMRPSLMSESTFKNNGALITCKEYYKKLTREDKDIIKELQEKLDSVKQTTLFDEEESYFVQGRIMKDLSLGQYKSPLSVTLITHSPERQFVEMLIKNYIDYIDSWVKSKDKGFYSIPYIHKPGTHSIQKDFNPDFLIKKGKRIIVVEIKSEDDSTVKNKDKLEGAITYFNKLNEKLNEKLIFKFHFLDPRDYKQFFENVIKKTLAFKSKLHADLESKSREELKKGR
jgi:type III restriction enzyme